MKKLMETLRVFFTAAGYSFRFCWRNCRYYTVGLISTATLSSVLNCVAVLAMGFLVNAVQHALAHKDKSHFASLAGPLGLLIAVALAGVVVHKLNWYFSKTWRQTLFFDNQREVNALKASLDMARFRSKEFDDLTRKIDELPYGWRTRSNFSEEVLRLLMNIVSFCLFGAAIVSMHPIYALVLIVATLPMIFTDFAMANRWWNLSQGFVPKHKARGVMEGSFRGDLGFAQGKLFGQFPFLLKGITENVRGVLDGNKALGLEVTRKDIFTHGLATLGVCGVMIHAVWVIVTYGGNLGTLTMLLASARTFQGNLEAIVNLMAEEWNSARGMIMIEKEFFGMKPLMQTRDPVDVQFPAPPAIRLDKVCFAYPGTEQLVLKDVSFTVKAGSKVAIVGESGNGKTSLVGLLTRIYDPVSGTISAGDIDLRRILPEKWSEYATALTQDYRIFERTIMEEIASSRLGDPIEIERVMESVRFAHLTEVVENDPNGLNAQLGTEFGGRELSGGEKQRLALARAFYKGTPVLILDEPDARLDPISAQKVRDRVFALKGVTVIIITHHAECAQLCDDIIMLKSGEVVEQGSHAELVERGGQYADMFAKKQGKVR